MLLIFAFCYISPNSSFGSAIPLPDTAPEYAIRLIPAREGIVSQTFTDNSRREYRFAAMKYANGTDGLRYELNAFRFYFEYFFMEIKLHIWEYIEKSIASLPKRFLDVKLCDIYIHSRLESVDYTFQDLNNFLFLKYPSLKRVSLIQRPEDENIPGIIYKTFYRDGHFEIS